jgi:hypothetical protein
MKTFDYPEVATYKEKVLAIKYFKEVEKLLPCVKCRVHYRQYLKASPIEYHVDTRNELVRWLIDLHNKVNAQTGKRILSYEEAVSIYLPPEELPKTSYTLPTISVLILLTIIIVLIVNRRRQ